MKTHKKLVSILCAVALLVSALPAASAISSEALSEYAGQNIAVRVAYVQGNGEVAKEIVSVDIPQRARQKDEINLIRTAVSATAKSISANTVGSKGEQITARAPVNVTTSYSTVDGPIELRRKYKSLWFAFNNGTYTGSPSILTLKLSGGGVDGVTSSKSIYFELGGDMTEKANVDIVIVDGDSYQGTIANLWENDAFEVSCRVNRGTVRFAALAITGYYD